MSPIEHIIRPIVIGQLTGFIREHSDLLNCVNWFRPDANKEEVFANSAGKRIILDLTCDATVSRLREALLGTVTEQRQIEGGERVHASSSSVGGTDGRRAVGAIPFSDEEQRLISRAARLHKLLLLNAPEVIINNELKLVMEAASAVGYDPAKAQI